MPAEKLVILVQMRFGARRYRFLFRKEVQLNACMFNQLWFPVVK